MRHPAYYDTTRQYDERSDNVKMAKPGLALNGKQLEEMALTGRVQVPLKQAMYEDAYDIDNPNPLRRPNADITDAYEYSDSLAKQYSEAVEQYNGLVEKAKKDSISAPVPTPATESTQQ